MKRRFYIRKWNFIGQEGINLLINIISYSKIAGKKDYEGKKKPSDILKILGRFFAIYTIYPPSANLPGIA